MTWPPLFYSNLVLHLLLLQFKTRRQSYRAPALCLLFHTGILLVRLCYSWVFIQPEAFQVTKLEPGFHAREQFHIPIEPGNQLLCYSGAKPEGTRSHLMQQDLDLKCAQ